MCLLSVVILALGVNFLKFFVNFLCSVLGFLRKHIFNDNCCINYEKKKDENMVVAIRPSTPTYHTTNITMVDMSNNSIDNIMPWNIEKAKKVKFIPSPDDVPSRNTSKPPSRDSAQYTSHTLSFPNNF
jgi:hypothetical protein